LNGAHWKRNLTISSDDPDDILERARRLESSALAQIHDRFYVEVYRYVRYRLGDEQICEDIASDVFLHLLDALHLKRGPTQNLRGWLLGTASNLVNDQLRHRYKRQVENLDDLGQECLEANEDPVNLWENGWRVQEVRQAFRLLTSEQQHVLALRFAEERSLDDTAKIVGKSITAVKALQFRALASLRRFLEEKRE
jgi:RNA polymerase sigma-70 factor (ECF subfamily)